MVILVLDVAASEGGALSVLRQHYSEFQQDTDNNYILCVSTPELASKGNVTVLKYPWVKRSPLHRLWFELLGVKKLCREYRPDRVFSLQDVLLAKCKCERWIYLHHLLPYVKERFKLPGGFLFRAYQNVLGKLINFSLRRADKIIVQTNWMRGACSRVAKIDPAKVEVVRPVINKADIVLCQDRDKCVGKLFYPAAAYDYKNHMTVLQAMKIIKERGKLPGLSLFLTLSGNENPLAERLRGFAVEHGLSVEFLGTLPRGEVMRLYAERTLIFPSYIESFGLPLLEARVSNAPIIASDCPFSREILDGYPNAAFFDPFDAQNCADTIIEFFGK